MRVKNLLLIIAVFVLVIILIAILLDKKDYEFILVHDGLERNYQVYVPDGYEGDLPLVIYLHGGGGNMNSAYADGLDEMADKYGFILAMPEGIGERKLGRIWASWNGGEWEGGECCGNADDMGFISKMIDEIEINFNIDHEKIYVTGISNGGLMTNRVGCELSDKITAIATVAPTGILNDCNPSEPISILNIHGTEDPINPINGGEPNTTLFDIDHKRMTPYQVIEKWKKINSCSNESVTESKNENVQCLIYNDCLNNSKVELCIIEGMGHTYPSGLQYLPSSKIGHVSNDFSFDDIWDFFMSL